EDGVVGSEEMGDFAFEVLVNGLGAAYEADRRETESVCVESALGGLDHPRMGRQAEIIVRAEIEHIASAGAVLGANSYALQSGQDPLVFLQSAQVDFLKSGSVAGLGVSKHGSSLSAGSAFSRWREHEPAARAGSTRRVGAAMGH